MKLFKKQYGSSLIEALIGVTIVGIGALGLVNLQGQLLQSKSNANQNAEAMQIAKAKMEELRNYSTLNGYNAITSSADSFVGVNSTYARTWTVTKNTTPNYAVIALSVGWTRPDNTLGAISLSSRIASLNPVLSGMAMDNSSGTLPLTPGGSSSTPTTDPEEEVPPEVETPAEESPPQETGNTTVTTDSGVILTYNSSDDLIAINGETPVTISGTLTEASGGNSPPGIVNYSSISITATSGTYPNYCSYSENSTDTISYTCIFQESFSGSITVSGITGVKLCASMSSNAYSNQTTSLTGQNYRLFKSSKSCSGSTPYEIEML